MSRGVASDGSGAQDVAMDGGTVADPLATVRRMLQEHAPCETGYPGMSSCKICVGGHECADALDELLSREYPAVDWSPAIRQVLGLW